MKFVVYKTSDMLMEKEEYKDFTFFKTFSEDDILINIYFIEMDQLEDLKKLYEKFGKYVLYFDFVHFSNDSYLSFYEMEVIKDHFDGCIEIYDKYRE